MTSHHQNYHQSWGVREENFLLSSLINGHKTSKCRHAKKDKNKKYLPDLWQCPSGLPILELRSHSCQPRSYAASSSVSCARKVESLRAGYTWSPQSSICNRKPQKSVSCCLYALQFICVLFRWLHTAVWAPQHSHVHGSPISCVSCVHGALNDLWGEVTRSPTHLCNTDTHKVSQIFI